MGLPMKKPRRSCTSKVFLDAHPRRRYFNSFPLVKLCLSLSKFDGVWMNLVHIPDLGCYRARPWTTSSSVSILVFVSLTSVRTRNCGGCVWERVVLVVLIVTAKSAAILRIFFSHRGNLGAEIHLPRHRCWERRNGD